MKESGRRRMSDAVLLKLGGSVLTRKGVDGEIRHDILETVGREIGSRKEIPILIVHGAGSCGHPEAHRYSLAGGLTGRNREGIAVTHEAVTRLNTEVVTALRKYGTEAIGIHPLHTCFAESGRIRSIQWRNLREMLNRSLVPVLHGDVVMDGARGVTIVSGDQLVVCLARLLRFGRIGLATDVPGVLDGDRVIPEITPESLPVLRLSPSLHTDVTGGMEGKVQELLVLAREGMSAEIFHVDRLGAFLDGRPHGGTVVRGG
jgi:isopentenyl phosphate kinase